MESRLLLALQIVIQKRKGFNIIRWKIHYDSVFIQGLFLWNEDYEMDHSGQAAIVAAEHP